MRSVLKIPIDGDIEKDEKLVHYEIMAMVIQKCLSKIVNKMNKGQELTNGDIVSNYEISLTLFTVLQQTNNFVFSGLELFNQHLLPLMQLGYKHGVFVFMKGPRNFILQILTKNHINLFNISCVKIY